MIGEEGEPAEGLSSPSSTLSLAASFDLSCFFPGIMRACNSGTVR